MENTPKQQKESVIRPSLDDVEVLRDSFHDALLIVSMPPASRSKIGFRMSALAALLLPILLLHQHDGGSMGRPEAAQSAMTVVHAAAPADQSSAAMVAASSSSAVPAASSSSVPPELVAVMRLNIPQLQRNASSSSVSTQSTVSSQSLRSSGKPDNHVGVYLTAGSASRHDFLLSTMEDSGKAGANTIVVDAKTNYVLFNTKAPMADKLGLVSPQYNLQDLVETVHQRGMYLIMRYVAISDTGLTSALPDTQLKDPKTGKVITPGYIDPANPVALQYNSEIICDLAKNGVDEINLDYIRFATSNVYATSVYSTAQKSARITAFVQMARDTINRCGPRTKLGISVFAILGWSFQANVATLGQNIPDLAPIVDVVSPMAYPAMFQQNAYYDPSVDKGSRMYYLVARSMQNFQTLMGDDAWKLRPWIQGYGVTTKNVQDQIEAVMDSGLCGFQFWNAQNAYGTVEHGMQSWAMPERCR